MNIQSIVSFVRLSLTATLALLTIQAASAADVTWSGSASPDLNWILPGPSPYANWVGDANPASQSLFFDNTSARTTRTAPNNVVAANILVASVRYMNLGDTATDWHVTSISSGVTLTVGSGFTVGGYSTGNNPAGFTQAAVTGAGTLSVLGGAFTVGSHGVDPSVGVLDMSGLQNFNYSVNSNFGVGYGRANTGLLTLGHTNAITANKLIVGDSGGNNAATTRVSSVKLGDVNVLKINDIFVGASDINVGAAANGNRQSGELLFRDPGASVTIRGRLSTDEDPTAANLTLGKISGPALTTGLSATITATADFTGGSVDALFNNLVMAEGKNTGGSMTALLAMDAGEIVAQNVWAGRSMEGGTDAAGFATASINVAGGAFSADTLIMAENVGGGQNVSGNLNISGGTVEVTGTGGIVMGVRTGTAAEVRSQISIASGSLEVHGDIARGTDNAAVISGVALNGGLLEMNGNDVRVSTLGLQSGTLRNLGEFNSGATLVKSTAGTLIVDGINEYTGTTDVAAGVFVVSGSLNATSQVIVRADAVLRGGGHVQSAAEVQIENEGTLALGNGSEVLSIGSLDLQAGGVVSLALDSVSNYGQLNVNGSIMLDDAALELTLNYAVLAGESFTVFSNLGGNPISGRFTTVNGNAIGLGDLFTVDYNGDSYQFQLLYDLPGSNLVILAVPEPGTVVLAALGLGLFFGARNLRRRA